MSQEIHVVPFGIEAQLERNGFVILQALDRVVLRSEFDPMRGVKKRNGDYVIPVDQVKNLGAIPKHPGEWLFVNPAKLEFEIHDPLHDEEFAAVADKLMKYIKSQPGNNYAKLPLRQDIRGKVADIHQMKTLCREMLTLVQRGEAKVVKGPCPIITDIDEMPGYYLLNPGMQVQTTQPRYEHQLPDYINHLISTGM